MLGWRCAASGRTMTEPFEIKILPGMPVSVCALAWQRRLALKAGWVKERPGEWQIVSTATLEEPGRAGAACLGKPTVASYRSRGDADGETVSATLVSPPHGVYLDGEYFYSKPVANSAGPTKKKRGKRK